MKKVEIPLVRFKLSEYKKLPDTMYRGAAPALNQLGYCIKVAFCNNLAMALAGIIPLALILTSFMGITGIWTAFALLSILLLLGILITNYVIAARSGGRFRGFLLYEYEEEGRMPRTQRKPIS